MYRSAFGQEGATGRDDDYGARANTGFGAIVMGHNMFGPTRGAWPDNCWKGWWADEPPFLAPVFVLTHHRRDPVVMQGRTPFYSVTGDVEETLARAKAAAGDMEVKINGGVNTIRQFVEAGLVDEMHLVMAPVVLGSGESMFAGLDLPALGLRVTSHEATEKAIHLTVKK